MENKVNLLLLTVLILFVLTAYFYHAYTHLNWLFVLKTAFEAATIGAIADAYAVYGLFRKLGPHTDLLRRKRGELSEKVTEFVGEFLLNKEYIAKEIEKINFEFVIDQIDNPETRKKVKELILNIINKRKDEYGNTLLSTMSSGSAKLNPFLKTMIEAIKDAITQLIENNLEDWIEEAFRKLREDKDTRNKVDDLLKKYLTKLIEEKHSYILDLIKNRIDSISDEEFISAVKKASWDELQWIRVNGTLLGFAIGVLLGTIQIIII